MAHRVLYQIGEHLGEQSVASPEHEVVGEAPNLAARLQALATPDSVLIASTRAALSTAGDGNGGSPDGGPMVRILLPPAESSVRTLLPSPALA